MNNLEKPVYVSAEGLKKIQSELETLKTYGGGQAFTREGTPA